MPTLPRDQQLGLVPGLPLAFFRGYSHNGDPRLLTPKQWVALRRDRYASVLYNIAAIVLVTLRTRRLLINDDHMIWNYRKRLEEIAAGRRPGITSASVLSASWIPDR